ncbi:MAG: hypothetical protein MK209_08285, partial [Planctomycetes bacterium]|nr:hypothetical protein [Planctomycetota bacterium]
MTGRPWVRTVPFCFAVIALGACQANLLAPNPPADYQPAELWAAIWQGDHDARRDLALAAGWQATGSIEGERYRQAELLAAGRRSELLFEAERRLAESPFDPDLAYLHARLFQDPVRLAARFEELANRHPRHAWIRLGAAGSLIQLGDLTRAEEHFRAAPDWPDAEEFRVLIEARLREQRGEPRPWRGLQKSALAQGSPTALTEMERMARTSGDRVAEEAASADQALRAQAPAVKTLPIGSPREGDALEILLRRLHAELALQPGLALSDTLKRLDRWAEHLGLPSTWQASPRYRLPFGAGLLLRPESNAGALSTLLERHQRVVLLGSSWLQGTQAVDLRGVQRLTLPWPDLPGEVEILLAETANGESRWVSGGAVFRGFFVRRDLSQSAARAWKRRAKRVQEVELPEGWSARTAPSLLEVDRTGSLPEDLDLALRLRAQVLNHQQAEAATWEALL